MGKEKILVVDDELVSRTLLKKLLSRYGECETASNGFEALDAFHLAHAHGEPFTLITLDIEMPDINGNQVLEHIRKWEEAMKLFQKRTESKILMVSARTEITDRMHSLIKGCEEFITKPVNSDNLMKTLSHMLVFPE